jgi:hypothetical protein
MRELQPRIKVKEIDGKKSIIIVDISIVFRKTFGKVL